MSEIPHWLRKFISEDGLASVQAAVTRAETKTSAEIVPMIVQRSILVGHVAPMLFLIYFLLFTLLIPLVAPYIAGIPWWLWEVGSLVLAVALAFPQSRLAFWQRALTPKQDEIVSSLNRAQLEFYQSGLRDTAGETGVLIFISALERQVVILADRAIDEKCPPGTWDKIVELLIARVHKEDFAAGFSEAILAVGDLLAEKFPIKAGDRNELANHLIIKN